MRPDLGTHAAALEPEKKGAGTTVRQAITTKYLGPTDYRGARVKATASAGSVTLSWDDAKDVDDNHYAAALALALKFEWTTMHDLDKGTVHIVGGGLPSGTGNVYVLVYL